MFMFNLFKWLGDFGYKIMLHEDEYYCKSLSLVQAILSIMHECHYDNFCLSHIIIQPKRCYFWNECLLFVVSKLQLFRSAPLSSESKECLKPRQIWFNLNVYRPETRDLWRSTSRKLNPGESPLLLKMLNCFSFYPAFNLL